MLYAFCHEFVSLTFEGDELYTIVGNRTDTAKSKGWTAVIMEGTSRFIVDQKCGEKSSSLFRSVMKTVCQFVENTEDLSFLSDGERRYGNMLFELCSETLETGRRGRPTQRSSCQEQGEPESQKRTQTSKISSPSAGTFGYRSKLIKFRHTCKSP